MLQKIRKRLVFLRFSVREWWPLWFYFLNRKGRRLFLANPSTINDVGSGIVKTLRTHGIAFSSLEELFPEENLLSTLQSYAATHSNSLQQTSKKEFILNYWEFIPTLDLKNPFVQFAIRPEITSIAYSYMEMWTRLNYYHLAKTLPVGTTEATFSQNWHRDSEEKRMLKVFIYLTDVDEDSGPFIYVQKSTYMNKYGDVAPQRPPEGSYPPDSLIEENVSADDVITATGKAGTVIFCDTSGLHRGGYAKSKERIMSTTFYTADTWLADAPRYRHSAETRAAVAKEKADIIYLLEKDSG